MQRAVADEDRRSRLVPGGVQAQMRSRPMGFVRAVAVCLFASLAMGLGHGCSGEDASSRGERVGRSQSALTAADSGTGSDASSVSAGQGGTAGATAGTTMELSIVLPHGLARTGVALGASTGGLRVGEGVRVLAARDAFGVLSNMGVAAAKLGGESGDVFSVGDVELLSHAVVHGVVRSAGRVIQRDGSIVTVAAIEGAKIAPEVFSWDVSFPSANLGDREVSGTLELPPGSALGNVTVLGHSVLRLAAGPDPYTFESLVVRENGRLELVNQGEHPLQIFVRSGLTLAGEISPTQDQANVLFGFFGSSPVIKTGLPAITLIAPHATVTLPNVSTQHSGGVFAASIEVDPGAHFSLRPFERSDCATADPGGCGAVFGCAPVDTDGDGISDCDEVADGSAFTDPNAFNGVLAVYRPLCHSAPSSDLIDTSTELDQCLALAPIDVKQQYSGWNWLDPATSDICDPARLYLPTWNVCARALTTEPTGDRLRWSVSSDARINLQKAGFHCFAITGTADHAAGSLFFNGTTEGITFASGPKCFSMGAGVYPIRWFYETAGNSRFDVNYCFDENQECVPVAGLPSSLLSPTEGPGCSQCLVGQPCTISADCGEGLVCGTGNGPHFGLPRGTNACWDAALCEGTNPACGSLQAACGFCDNAITCTSDASCPSGDVCGVNNGGSFELGGSRVCWPSVCQTDAASHCGDLSSLCGNCTCAPSCDGKKCGDNPADGCGGQCTNYCAEHEAGCTNDYQCQNGGICVIGGGPRIGLAEGTNVCLSAVCRDDDVQRLRSASPPLCGDVTSTCGLCPACQADCSNRACGNDLKCGASCGSCGRGQYCAADADGATCVATSAPSPVEVKDGLGGTRTIFPLAPVPGAELGALAGAFSVSDRGAAVYSVPVQLPPGRSGLQPSFNIVYSSLEATGNKRQTGFLGAGWSLDLISVISRCKITAAQAEHPGAVSFDSGDHLCLDGSRLVTADGINFSTEIDGFSNIVNHPEICRHAPCDVTGYFEVFTKDGRILRYGSTDNSSLFASIQQGVNSIKRAWALDQISDRAGNTVSITYRNITTEDCSLFPTRCATHEFYPALLSYGGNIFGLKHSRFVDFIYGGSKREDSQTTIAPGGIYINKTRRLERIQTRVEDTVVKSYELNFIPALNGVSELHGITECDAPPDSSARKCKPPSEFKYHPLNPGFGNGVVAGVAPLTAGTRSFLALDHNGDGRQDFLTWLPGTSGQRVGAAVLYEYTGNRANPLKTTLVRVRGFECGEIQAVDINGDGRDDLFDVCDFMNGGENYKLLLSDGESFEAPIDVPARGIRVPWLVDVDGDGLVDLVETTGGDFETHTLLWRHGVPNIGATAGKFFSDQDEVFASWGACRTFFAGASSGGSAVLRCNEDLSSQFFMADTDGDGVDNLVLEASAGGKWGALTVSPNGETYIAKDLSRPLGSNGSNRAFFLIPGGTAPRKLVDYNGDGFKDVVGFQRNTNTFPSTLALWTNWANAFKSASFPDFPEFGFLRSHPPEGLPTKAKTTPAFPFPFEDELRTTESILKRAMVVDFDADGREDLLTPHVAADGSSSSWDVSLARGNWTTDTRFVPFNETLSGVASRVENGLPHPEATVLDLDGDSDKDVILIDKDGHLAVFFGQNSRANLLESITDGLGKRVDISYDAVGSDGARTYTPAQDCGWPTRCAGNAGPVVSAQVFGRMIEGALVKEGRVDYHYKDARTDIHGHGWLGFAERTIKERDAAGKLVRETAIDYDNSTVTDLEGNMEPELVVSAARPYFYPFRTRVTHTTTTTAAAQSTSRGDPAFSLEGERWKRVVDSENTWDFEFTGGSMFTRLFTFLKANDTKTYDETVQGERKFLTGTCSTTLVDTLGNPTDQLYYHHNQADRACTRGLGFADPGFESLIVDSHVLDVRRTETTYEPPDESQWLINLVQSRTVTDAFGPNLSDPAYQAVRFSSFTYFDNGLLHTATRATPGEDTFLKTTLTRDISTGNITDIQQQDRTSLPRTTHFEYDPAQIFPLTIKNAKGQITQVRYGPAQGEILIAADPNGIPQQWQYDTFGRVIKRLSPSVETNISYEVSAVDTEPVIDVLAAYLVRTNTTGYGRQIQEFDAYARPVRVIASGYDTNRGQEALVHQEFEYDDRGRLLRTSRPHLTGFTNQGIIRFDYDEQNRRTAEHYPDGSDVEFLYATRNTLSANAGVQPPGNFTHIRATVDPKKQRDIQFFDQRGNAVRTLDAQKHPTDYAYGPFRALTSVIDSAGNKTKIVTDAYGRTIFQTDPDMGQHFYSYSGFGELLTHTNNATATTSIEYDELGRPKLQNDPDGTTKWTYDGTGPNEIGRLVELETTARPGSSKLHKIRYHYEPAQTPTLNRGVLKSIDEIVGGQATADPDETFTTTFDYDDFARVTQVHYPDQGGAFAVQYNYDTSSGNLFSVSKPTNPNDTYWKRTKTDQALRIAEEKYGNGITTTSSYENTTGRLAGLATTHAGTDLQVLSYFYDVNGNVTSLVDATATTAKVTDTFTFDSLDRLTDQTRKTGVTTENLLHVDYDPIGNITKKDDQPYTYDNPDNAHPHAVHSAFGETYTYSPEGNLEQRDGPARLQTFENYTPFNLPRKITTQNKSAGTTTAVDLEYNPLQRRLIKKTPAETTLYIGDYYERVTPAASSTPVTHKFRIYAAGKQVAQTTRIQSGTNLSAPTTVFLHQDALGSTRFITDEKGVKIHSQEFTPFGEAKGTPSWQSGNASAKNVLAGFTGHEQDPESDLVNANGRLYDPKLGKFTTADPFIQAPLWSQGLNRYSYAWNNPLKYVDPSGFDSDDYQCGGDPSNIQCPNIGIALPPASTNIPTNTEHKQEVDPCSVASCGPPPGSGPPPSSSAPPPDASGNNDQGQMQASHGPDPSDFSAAQDASLQAGIRNGIAQGNAAGRAAADAARAGGAGTSDEFKFWGKTIEQHAADVVTFFIADPLECILGNECGVGGAALAAASFGRLGKLARASMEVEDALLVGQVARRARLTQEAVEHIALRHFPTSGATNAGKFATTSLREIRALISETVERGAIRPNTLGRPGNIFELTFGRQIGTNAAGEAATSLRVVVTPEGLVTTAFPF